eukprot:TRINITY_DN6108_c0_g1_i2.p1 TRINITY_DN6108_c0_g1~~TRINITY_DN6108_c0_g1_i2.p1  ORF type:complete len:206 (+),score=56.49 TRINITY_DN6108_c0_g1_i2:215-832(+)
MVNALAENYGDNLGTWNGEDIFAFPSLEQLAAVGRDELENQLRERKFGYRAKYIANTVDKLIEYGGEQWLNDLRNHPNPQEELVKLDGVGRKVADCIALFSLDDCSCIPVDTHVFSIAQRYDSSLRNKNLNPKLYQRIFDIFNKRFNAKKIGWAHSVCFASELPLFNANWDLILELEAQEKNAKREREEEEEESSSSSSERKKRK